MPRYDDSRGGKNRGSLTSAQQNLFVAGTNFRGEGGRLAGAFRGMALRQGKVVLNRKTDRTYWGERVRDSQGRIKGFNKSKRNPKGFSKNTPVFRDTRNIKLPSWYSGPGKHNVKGKGYYTKNSWRVGGLKEVYSTRLKSLKEVALQLAIASHLSVVQMEHWKHVLALRALKIFQESFELKRFNSDGEPRWRPNTRNTYLKRVHKGTWPGAGRLMMESGALQKSLHVVKRGIDDYAVTTGPAANGRIYAGVHNNPKSGMTYGRIFGAQPVTQRQFMGHSTKIEEFMATYEKKYLFDMVFRTPNK